jgi:hypothetical protein
MKWTIIKDDAGDLSHSRIVEADGMGAVGGFMPDDSKPQEIVDKHNREEPILSLPIQVIKYDGKLILRVQTRVWRGEIMTAHPPDDFLNVDADTMEIRKAT